MVEDNIKNTVTEAIKKRGRPLKDNVFVNIVKSIVDDYKCALAALEQVVKIDGFPIEDTEKFIESKKQYAQRAFDIQLMQAFDKALSGDRDREEKK